MKRKAHTYLLIGFLGLILLTGCGVLKPSVDSYPRSDNRPRFAALYIDLSGTTISDRQDYLETFEAMLPRLLGYGDGLIINVISNDSIQASKPIGEGEIASFIPPPKPKLYWYDVPLEQASKKNDYKKLLAEKKREFLKENNLESVRQELAANVQSRIMSEKTDQTDIFGAIISASQIFSAKPNHEKILMLFSDMLLENGLYNFRTEKLTDERIVEIIAQEKAEDRLPDLSGAHVFIVGARANDQETFLNVKKFWLKYFEAAGANLRPRFYGRAMPEVIMNSSSVLRKRGTSEF